MPLGFLLRCVDLAHMPLPSWFCQPRNPTPPPTPPPTPSLPLDTLPPTPTLPTPPRMEHHPMPHYVYILRCADNSYYIGQTQNPSTRVAGHNQGHGPNRTRHRRPVTLVHVETYPSAAEAFHRERQLKRWSRAKKEALINNDLQELKALSKSSSRPS